MSLIKQLILNRLSLPIEIINIVKEYLFHEIKKIQKNDIRYKLLLTIPLKENDYTDNSTYVYIRITDDKDYFMVYSDFEIQLQTLRYEDNRIYFLDGSVYSIE